MNYIYIASNWGEANAILEAGDRQGIAVSADGDGKVVSADKPIKGFKPWYKKVKA